MIRRAFLSRMSAVARYLSRLVDAVRRLWRALRITDEELVVEALLIELEAGRVGADDIRREAERIRWSVGLGVSRGEH